ncbi:hypothetical protein PIB30_055168 [Stylosanthes scabra]|uniref:Uncharacterized protein n=1 Tax=Stylosanthes scabra TaxID=79078 RepID=A0ABU6VKP5_9FABA|nr:hypothetical protein [Stylosanthes scabra]
MASRRPVNKWHLPPPPTPILHFPRRRRLHNNNTNSNDSTLETLFHRERRTSAPPIVLFANNTGGERRERVAERSSGGGRVVVIEEDNYCKFQADMLRAECNLLRMEKEIAFKKLQRTRSKIDATLRSALRTLVSGRIKIFEGEDIETVLDEGIRELTEKLQRMQKRSPSSTKARVSNNKDYSSEGRSINSRTKNFDKQVSVLQRRLDKIGGSSSSDEIFLRQFQEMENISFSVNTIHESVVARGKINVEILKRKMEGLSKGVLLKRMEEEYNSMSATTSKRIELQDSSSSSIPLPQPRQEKLDYEGGVCSGECKMIVRRIVEQVRAETEQWSQMQEMLGQVKEEMEELQASRNFWEDRALNSDNQVKSLHNAVQEWKERALSSENKTKELEARISMVCGGDVERNNNNELEKRVVMVCSSKENSNSNNYSNKHKKEVSENGECNKKAQHGAATIGGVLATKRTPFGDIGNSSSLLVNRNVTPYSQFHSHSHIASNADKIF